MPTDEPNFSFGTQAILDAPIEDKGKTLEVALNPEHRKRLVFVLDKETNRVWMNGHPFGRSSALLSVLARKLYLMEQRSRRTS